MSARDAAVMHLLGEHLLPACGAEPVDLGDGFFSCGTGDASAVTCPACIEWMKAVETSYWRKVAAAANCALAAAPGLDQ